MKTWKKHFDNEFTEQGSFKVCGTPDEVKTFITKLLKNERTKVLQLVCIALNGKGTPFDIENWTANVRKEVDQLEVMGEP